MTDEKEKKPLERLNTADGRRELRAMLREIMAAAPDPGDRGHVANALLERLGIVLLDSTLIDITAFKGWFDGAYEAMLDDYPKRDEDRCWETFEGAGKASRSAWARHRSRSSFTSSS
jgi:hypothetical protein